jgi:hypothetical protein
MESKSIRMQFLGENSKKARGTDLALWFIARIESTKELGWMTIEKAKAWSAIQMEINMKEILLKERRMVREFTIGQMEKSMTESGAKESRRVMACGGVFLAIHTLASGRIVKQMATECINGRMEIDMKAAGSIVSNMVKVQTFLLMVMFTLAITPMVKLTEKVYINGKTVVSIKVSSRRV